MKIYTKKGDEGLTYLFDNKRVSKDDIRVESYGTIDELTSWLGLTKNHLEDDRMYKEINHIQDKLFIVASILATEDQSKIKEFIEEKDIEFLEEIVDYYMIQLKEKAGFVVPGADKKSAYLHVARTICRRAERRVISLSKFSQIEPLVMKYINRLSDSLYSMARFIEEREEKN